MLIANSETCLDAVKFDFGETDRQVAGRVVFQFFEHRNTFRVRSGLHPSVSGLAIGLLFETGAEIVALLQVLTIKSNSIH